MFVYTQTYLASLSLAELKALIPPLADLQGDRRYRQTYTDYLCGRPLPLFAEVTEVQEELPNDLCNSSPVTFSEAFLQKFSPPPQTKRVYFFDEDGEPLGLWSFSEVSEAPDPDDFATLPDFEFASAQWHLEHEPLILADLESMVYWAPCPWEWYEPSQDLPSASHNPSEIEIPLRCPCGAVPATRCDGETAVMILPDRLERVRCFKYNLIEGGARSPPCCSVLFPSLNS